jgi:glyoxylase-like metal-dependent hydrolase (beta-lactamase superfamily II)
MTQFKILAEGYANKRGSVWQASSTSVLIIDNGKKIVVDPGTNKEMLLAGLAKAGLEAADIDLVFLTHYHPDHILNIRLFPDVPIYDGDAINDGDKILEYSGTIPGTDVKVMATPGHNNEHASLLITTDLGKVAVAGDVFWWPDGQNQETDRGKLLSLEDEFLESKKQLVASRKKILDVADYIIPGHGPMFKVV